MCALSRFLEESCCALAPSLLKSHAPMLTFSTFTIFVSALGAATWWAISDEIGS